MTAAIRSVQDRKADSGYRGTRRLGPQGKQGKGGRYARNDKYGIVRWFASGEKVPAGWTSLSD